MFIAETRTFGFQNVFAHAEKSFNCSAQGQRRRSVSLVLYQQRNYIILFSGTADKNPSIRFAASSFFDSDWLNKQPKNSSLLNGLNIVVAFTAKPVSPVGAQ